MNAISNGKTYQFVSLKTDVGTVPAGMLEQVVQRNEKEGFAGFRVVVPSFSIKAILNAVDTGEAPALAAFLESEVAAKQREVLKRMSLNGAAGADDADIDLFAINAFIESSRTISISMALWAELFAPVAHVIMARVAEVKKLPDDLDAEAVLRVAQPTITFWRARWDMVRKTGGVVSEEERAKLLEFFELAVEASGTIDMATQFAAKKIITGIRAGADAVSVDVVAI